MSSKNQYPLPPITASNSNKHEDRLSVHQKIKSTLRDLQTEKKAKRDLESRCAEIRDRISQLETDAPFLQSAQDSYYNYNLLEPVVQPQSPTSTKYNNNNSHALPLSQSQRKQHDENMRSRSELFNPETNPEAVWASRENFRLNRIARLKNGSHAPTAPLFATSALTSFPQPPPGAINKNINNNTKSIERQQSLAKKSNQNNGGGGGGEEKAGEENILKFPKTTTAESYQYIPPPLPRRRHDDDSHKEENGNHCSTSSYYVELQKRERAPATHVFPNVSAFFSYPPRDERGFLLPSGRSSKRTAFARTYANESILGASEDAVNQERYKRAEKICLDQEKEAIAKSRATGKNNSINNCDGELYPVKPVVKPTVLYTPRDKKQPGMSKTAELAVHMMAPAGKKLLQIFEDGDHKFKSSRRTLFYTDYTGKPFMIDCCDMPKQDGFVLTGM